MTFEVAPTLADTQSNVGALKDVLHMTDPQVCFASSALDVVEHVRTCKVYNAAATTDATPHV